eukprot:5828435-Amphidinium_carterae.1
MCACVEARTLLEGCVFACLDCLSDPFQHCCKQPGVHATCLDIAHPHNLQGQSDRLISRQFDVGVMMSPAP